MEKLQFKTIINAIPEKVWSVLLNENTYPLWTSVFAEGSTVKTDWKKGSKALFLDGNNQGMVSTIVENISNEFLSIKHLGTIKDFDSLQTKKWAGGLEDYTLINRNGSTELVIDIDVTKEFKP